MDKKLFKDSSTGQIVPIDGGEFAFIPDALPPEWIFSADLWPLLVQAKHLIGLLEGMGRVLPNPAILLRSSEDREAIQSSALEGTYATPKELLLFELEPRESSVTEDRTNDFREVMNYRFAIKHATNDDHPITLNLLRQVHAILLAGVRGHQKDPGNFRKIQVAIGSNHRFVPPPPQHVPPCLDALEKYIHSDSVFDPLVDCFLVHYQFESIHPFIDGNGRIGRLLLALMLQKKCGMSKPWLYLSDFFERHRDEYIQKLFRISTNGEWQEWIEFCLRATIAQANGTISRCERLLAIRVQYHNQVTGTGGHVRLHTIVDEIFESPFVRVIDVQKRLKITYPTAKSDLEKLAEGGILRPLPNVSPRTYYAPDVYQVAYENIADNSEA